MSITKFALDKSRVSILAVIGIAVIGLYYFLNYPSQEDPSITVRTAQVTASYAGMSAARIEQLITRKIEEKIREIPEIKKIESTSKAGRSVVKVTVHERYFELQPIWQNLRNKMEDVKTDLPSDTKGPVVNDDYGLVVVATIMLTNDGFPGADWRNTARRLRDRLTAVPGVKKVELSGIREERVYLEINNARLSQYGLSPTSLIDSLQSQNIILPGGKITSRGTEILIEPSGNFNTVSDIAQAVIALPKSKQVAYLRDVAEVKRVPVNPPEELAYYNGKPAIAIEVSMIAGTNAIKFGERLKARVTQLENQLPWGYKLSYATFQPARVDTAITDFAGNLYQTIAVVLVVVVLFLGLRTGLIVGAIVPMTMLLAIIVMRLGDIDLQRVSIASLIIALGMLVDNGIVVAEDIKRRLEMGGERRRACIDAGRELAIPLLTSTLTSILAFAPLLLADNETGEYLRSLAMVMLITLLSSWFLAMFATPLLCFFFIKVKPRKTGPAGDEGGAYDTRFYRGYRALLTGVLRIRYAFLVVVIAAFVGSLFLFQLIPVQFMPESDRNQLQITIDLPAGATSNETDRVVKRFTGWLHDRKANPDVTSSAAYVAYGGPRFFLALSPIDPDPNRAFVLVTSTDDKVIPALKHRIERYFLERAPNARAAVKTLFLGAVEPGVVDYRVVGPDSAVLRRTGDAIKAAIRKVGNTPILKDDWDNPTLTVFVKVDQARAGRAGVTSKEIAASLNFAFSGSEVTDYREGDAVIPVIVRGEDSARFTLDRLPTISVFSSSQNKNVPLLQIADFVPRWDDSRIKRRDQERTLTVSAKHAVLLATDFHKRVKPALDRIAAGLPAGYRIDLGGELESAGQANKALLDNMPICLAAIALLLIWQFNSFRRTGIIAMTVPLSLIGASVGLLVLQAKFGFTSLLGILALVGIVINNAIVLIDRIELERAGGASIHDAILNAAVKRLRPIMITSITTILGLLPLLLLGGELWYGMSAVIMFGMGVGTILTLGVVPVLYAIFFPEKKEKKEKERAPTAAPAGA
ncbi:MAG: efflux RND transporter permease subunit [Bauldia litoralis]